MAQQVNQDGMDEFSKQLVLDTFTSGGNHKDEAADLYKLLNSKGSANELVTKAHEVYKALGYEPGAIVLSKRGGALGKIKKMNMSSRGMYPGDRYPVYITMPGGNTFEYSLFTEHYGDVASYVGKEKKLLKDHGDDLQWILVKGVKNPDEIMAKQNEIYQIKKRDNLLEYLENNFPAAPEKKDYVYEYAKSCLLRSRENALYGVEKEPALFQEVVKFVDSDGFEQIKNAEIRNALRDKFLEILGLGYKFENKDMRYSIPTSMVFQTYQEMKNDHYKVMIKRILRDRIETMSDNELYTFSGEAEKAGDKEMAQIILDQIEKRIG